MFIDSLKIKSFYDRFWNPCFIEQNYFGFMKILVVDFLLLDCDLCEIAYDVYCIISRLVSLMSEQPQPCNAIL